jgi:hypothetical protein
VFQLHLYIMVHHCFALLSFDLCKKEVHTLQCPMKFVANYHNSKLCPEGRPYRSSYNVLHSQLYVSLYRNSLPTFFWLSPDIYFANLFLPECSSGSFQVCFIPNYFCTSFVLWHCLLNVPIF